MYFEKGTVVCEVVIGSLGKKTIELTLNNHWYNRWSLFGLVKIRKWKVFFLRS